MQTNVFSDGRSLAPPSPIKQHTSTPSTSNAVIHDDAVVNLCEETVEKHEKTGVCPYNGPMGNLADPHDIDPMHTRLLTRWHANRGFRAAGLERELARVTLGPTWRERYHALLEGLYPLAFENEAQFVTFVSEVQDALLSSGIRGWIALRGSATTFLSAHPEKGVDPTEELGMADLQADPSLPRCIATLHFFDCEVVRKGGRAAVAASCSDFEALSLYSDVDVNIKSPDLVSALHARNAIASGKEVGGCFNQDDTMDLVPLLWEVKARWSARLQRDVSFVALTSANDIHGYSKHPFTFPIS